LSKQNQSWQYGNGTKVIKTVSRKRKQVTWKIRIKQFRKQKTSTGKIIEDSETKMRWSEEAIPYCENKEQAEEYLQFRAKEEMDKLMGKHQPKAEPVSLNKFAEEYVENYAKEHKKSWAHDANRINHFKRFLKEKGKADIMLSDINTRLIEQFKVWKRKHSADRELKRQTVNKDLNVLSKMLQVAVEWQYLEEDNLPKVNRYKKTDPVRKAHILTFEEQERLLALVPTYMKDIILIALHTGMRKEEILGLRWAEVHLNDKIIRLPGHRTKNGKDRNVKLNSTALNTLLKLKKRHALNEFVFVNPATHTRYYRIKTAFNTAKRKAGVPRLTFHSLRHTCATRLKNAGVPKLRISEDLGHQDTVMTSYYLHDDEELERRDFDLLDEYCQQRQNNGRSSSYAM
jgi:integrase